MFQYASAKVLSAKLNRPIKVNLQFYKSAKKGITKRHYCLDIFKKEENEIVVKDSAFLKVQYPVLKRLNHTLRLKEIDWNRLDEYNKFKKIILDGYFFDLVFLESNKSILQSIFEFNKFIEDENKYLLHDIKEQQSVGVHIRRGDYLTATNKQIYHVCDKEYFVEAINCLCSRIAYPFFYIFSDDIEWCKKNINLKDIAYKFVNLGSKNKDVSEFFLMANCKHNIIANSTYSWWAAYLNNEHGNIVIAPKFWYKDESQNDKARDLIPSDWIIL